MKLSLIVTFIILAALGLAARLRLKKRETARLGVMDRRKNPREFLVSGWDPYIVSLKTGSATAELEAGTEFSRARPLVRRLIIALLAAAGVLTALMLLT